MTSTAALAAEPTSDAVLKTYADIALAGYEDALATAKALDVAADALIATPSEVTIGGGAGRVESGAPVIPADRGVPLRQCDR